MHDPSIDHDQARAANAHFAPVCVPVSSSDWRRKSARVSRGATLHDTWLPLTVMLKLTGSLTALAS